MLDEPALIVSTVDPVGTRPGFAIIFPTLQFAHWLDRTTRQSFRRATGLPFRRPCSSSGATLH
jgi:hypothetical protein